jgi:DNA-binding beta-propeller fold protein YncE
MKNLNSIFSIAIALVLLSACKKDDDSSGGAVLPASNSSVLISCEGSFGAGNASISSYDSGTQEVVLNAFEAVNGYGPGDVMQSLTEYMGQLYMVMNGSAKIEVASASTLQAESPINGTISPRKLLPVSDSKAYVSNLFSNEVQVIDLSSKVVSGSIDVGGWSEGMVLIGDEAFIARNNGSELIVVDVITNEVIDSVEVGLGPIDVVQDVNGDIWVLGFGFDASFNVIDAHLSHLDPETRAIIGTYEIPQPWSYKMALAVSKAGNRLFVLNNKVYQMGILDSAVDSEALIDNGNSNYGIGVNPVSGDIYVGYAPDFSSEGRVYRYASDGTFLDDFEVGIAPNGFHFGQ